MFKQLNASEELSFRNWARENFSLTQEVNPMWHPVVRDEWAKLREQALNGIQNALDKGG